MRIERTDLQLRRESFARAFGFKGSAFHEKLTPVVCLKDAGGVESVGVGGLAPLWSDHRVFVAHGETAMLLQNSQQQRQAILINTLREPLWIIAAAVRNQRLNFDKQRAAPFPSH